MDFYLFIGLAISHSFLFFIASLLFVFHPLRLAPFSPSILEPNLMDCQLFLDMNELISLGKKIRFPLGI
jgi:hypothetical protein